LIRTKDLVGLNTATVYGDPLDEDWISHNAEIKPDLDLGDHSTTRCREGFSRAGNPSALYRRLTICR